MIETLEEQINGFERIKEKRKPRLGEEELHQIAENVYDDIYSPEN